MSQFGPLCTVVMFYFKQEFSFVTAAGSAGSIMWDKQRWHELRARFVELGKQTALTGMVYVGAGYLLLRGIFLER